LCQGHAFGIVDLYFAVAQEQGHILPTVKCILDGFTDGARRSGLVIFGLEPLSEGVEYGFGFFESQLEALIGIQAQVAGFFFDVVQEFNTR
jgi:hypothetical protein